MPLRKKERTFQESSACLQVKTEKEPCPSSAESGVPSKPEVVETRNSLASFASAASASSSVPSLTPVVRSFILTACVQKKSKGHLQMITFEAYLRFQSFTKFFFWIIVSIFYQPFKTRSEAVVLWKSEAWQLAC